MNAQIFIASYRNDFEWLKHALHSIEKFGKGFGKTVVNVPEEDYTAARRAFQEFAPDMVIVTKRPTVAGGKRAQFLGAQIAMMEADKYCPEAEYIFQVGSDTMFCGDFMPEMYLRDDKPLMLFSEYSTLQECHPDCLCWKKGTERVLDCRVYKEFMRRLPLVYRPQTLQGLRNQVFDRWWGDSFPQIIYDMDARDPISEANLVGAYAHQNEYAYYRWYDVGCMPVSRIPIWLFPNPVVQFWSHGGLDRPIPEDVLPEGVLAGQNLKGRTPRSIIQEVLLNEPNKLNK